MSEFEKVHNAAESAAVIGRLDVATELLERYRMGLLGSLWCDAEGIPTSWDQLSDEVQETITERIRHDEAHSPGDLVVRAARVCHELRRLDDTPSWLLQRFIEQYGKDKQNPLRRLHCYDSLEFGNAPGGIQATSSVRLFSNAHIGTLSRTNLRVAGQLIFDGSGFLTKFYLTTLPSVETLVGVVEFMINDKRIATALSHQLLQRPQPLDVYLPERQNVHAFYHADPPALPDGTRVYLHVEGFAVGRW